MAKKSWTIVEKYETNQKIIIEKIITNKVTKQSADRCHVNVPTYWLGKKVRIEVLD